MEKWHWSYMPIAKGYLNAYLEIVNYSDINGFMGEKLAKRLEIKTQYVDGIFKGCP